MKKYKEIIRQKIHGLSMRTKMEISFSIPIFIISIILFSCAGIILQKKYNDQLCYNAKQSSLQVNNFLESDFDSMNGIINQIAVNKSILDILAKDRVGTKDSYTENYADFIELNEAFQNIELSNDGYYIGIYVPDEYIFSNNNRYFYSESQLEALPDYDNIMNSLDKGTNYYGIVSEKWNFGTADAVRYFTRISRINVKTDSGKTVSYVIKVELPLSSIQKIFRNAKITEGNFICLVDNNENVLAVSDEKKYAGMGHDILIDCASQESWSTVRIGNDTYYNYKYVMAGNNWSIISLTPIKELRKQSEFITFLLIVMVALLAITVTIVSYLIARYYVGRLDQLNNNMNQVKEGSINSYIIENYSGNNDEVDKLYQNFDYMIDEVHNLMKSQYKLGKSISKAEMRALQAQINPHFLYNTLDLINWGAMDYGADNLAEIARSLGQFYRLSLNHGHSEILIGDELKHVDSFVRIENAHYEGAIHVTKEIPEEITNYACLNITLQPFVENCIVHGIGEHSDIKECNISISAVMEEGDIIFTVCDDGPGISQEIADSFDNEKPVGGNKGFGVSNINFRIKLCYGSEYGIKYNTDIESGTEVKIRIKALHIDELAELLA